MLKVMNADDLNQVDTVLRLHWRASNVQRRRRRSDKSMLARTVRLGYESVHMGGNVMLGGWIAAVGVLATLHMGAPPTLAQQCPGDLNGDHVVTIDEIITTVNAALSGCGEPSATPTVTVSPTPTVRYSPMLQATPTRTPTATPRFADNGNGTITDTTTGLVWEKQSDDGTVHDQHNRYSWSLSGSAAPNGTAFTLLLNVLNATNFGGHRDWRLPTLDELQTIVARGAIVPGQPVVPPQFNSGCRPGCSVTQCSCTTPLNYWTSTTNAAYDQQAWYVLFNTGDTGVGFKTLEFPTRAVRGGR
jgi:hypothetical protein